MNSIVNYIEFSEDIKQIFNDLMVKHNLNFYTIYEGCYELRNSYCIIRFTYDRGEIACNIRRIDDDGYGYSIISVFKYLHPSKNIKTKKLSYDPRVQLKNYEQILEWQLSSVLLGDFSWLVGYLKEQSELNKMIGFIWENIDKQDPIFKKFEIGDISWQTDLKNYLKVSGLSL